jgi:hypothetical protein
MRKEMGSSPLKVISPQGTKLNAQRKVYSHAKQRDLDHEIYIDLFSQQGSWLTLKLEVIQTI